MSADESCPPPDPNVSITLNANILDCNLMKGGYTSWRLAPNGSTLAPVTQKNTVPYTTSGANELLMTGTTGTNDVFHPQSSTDFNRGETIIVQGPTPSTGSDRQITFQGQESSIFITFKYVGTRKN